MLVQSFKDESPVLCAFSGNGGAVLTDKAAGNHQLTYTMKFAGLRAGLLTTLYSHDLRRGAVRDNANRKSKVTGAVTFGHTKKTYLSGVTDLYAGSLAEDGWSKRVEENFDDTFSIDVTDTAHKKLRKLDGGEIKERCEIDGLDSSNLSHRRAAAKKTYRKDMDDWMMQQLNRAEPSANNSTKSALSERTHSKINAEGLPRKNATGGASKLLYTADSDLEPPLPPKLSGFEDTTLVDDDIPIDPGSSETLVGSKSIEMTEEMENDAFVQLEDPQTAIDGLDFVLAEHIEFLRHFSRFNVTCNQSIAAHGLDSARVSAYVAAYQGNSRDELSLFQ